MKDNWLIFGRVLQGVGAVGFLVGLLVFLLVKAPETPNSMVQSCCKDQTFDLETIEIGLDPTSLEIKQLVEKAQNLAATYKQSTEKEELTALLVKELGVWGEHQPHCPFCGKCGACSYDNVSWSETGTMQIQIGIPACSTSKFIERFIAKKFVKSATKIGKEDFKSLFK